MMEMDAARDPRLGLEPGDIGGDERLSVAILAVGQREDRRQDRRRGVAAQRIADVIEIERVRRGAVDQRRVERAGAAIAAEDEARTMPAADRQRFLDDPRAIFVRPGQRHADGVEDRRLRPEDGLTGQAVAADRDDLLGDLFEQGHGGFLGRGRR